MYVRRLVLFLFGVTLLTHADAAVVSRRSPAPAAAPEASAKPIIAARAGTTQKVVSAGTKVQSAAENTVTDQNCDAKFNACMDAFCMQENLSGGRCICSSKIADLEKQLAEIEKINTESYRIASLGVDAVQNSAGAARSSGRNKVDLSKWNTVTSDDDAQSAPTGAALQASALKTCRDRLPECADSMTMLQTMYAQRINSDCAAYQNAIKEQRNVATQRRSESERSVRRASYEKLQSANKYDLGQCTIEFKKCMQTTGGCGDDFAGCASVAGMNNVVTRRVATRRKSSTYMIQGATSGIEISASTYEQLESKKPICDSILNSCDAVRDNVWATFLREAAPQLKSAEVLAESNMRTQCTANIAKCFQQACRDNMDPADPDGSYNLCLTRPESMLHLCKVELTNCGVDASSRAAAQKSQIWDYVVARLAAMRVDACTNDVRECLTSPTHCGSDYTACAGLDTDTIMRMCPYDKLQGCQLIYGETRIRDNEVYSAMADLVQGIMLNIDNNILEFCQNAVTAAMINVCGDTTDCNVFNQDAYIGANALQYKICEYGFDENNNVLIDYTRCRTGSDQIADTELGRIYGSTTGELGPVTPFLGLLDGLMFYELITVDDNGKLTDPEKYFEDAGATEISDLKREEIITDLTHLQELIDAAIQALESDPTVQYCMSGRRVRGMKESPGIVGQTARFPGITKQMRIQIANAGLRAAKANYYQKYDISYEQLMKDYVTIAERQAEIKGENAKDVRRELARQACVSLAEMSTLPMSPPPPAGWGSWFVLGIVIIAAVLVTVFTLGAASFAGAAATAAVTSATGATGAAAAATGAAAASAAMLGASAGMAGAAAAGAATAAGLGVAAAAAGGLAAGAAAVASVAVSSTVALISGIVGGVAAVGSVAAFSSNESFDQRKGMEEFLHGVYELDQWNYKETVNTKFDWDAMNCEKCIKAKKCKKPEYPWFGMPYCDKWEDESPETCTDVQF